MHPGGAGQVPGGGPRRRGDPLLCTLPAPQGTTVYNYIGGSHGGGSLYGAYKSVPLWGMYKEYPILGHVYWNKLGHGKSILYCDL